MCIFVICCLLWRPGRVKWNDEQSEGKSGYSGAHLTKFRRKGATYFSQLQQVLELDMDIPTLHSKLDIKMEVSPHFNPCWRSRFSRIRNGDVIQPFLGESTYFLNMATEVFHWPLQLNVAWNRICDPFPQGLVFIQYSPWTSSPSPMQTPLLLCPHAHFCAKHQDLTPGLLGTVQLVCAPAHPTHTELLLLLFGRLLYFFMQWILVYFVDVISNITSSKKYSPTTTFYCLPHVTWSLSFCSTLCLL